MIIINSVSNTLFSFNGIEYFRNYISVVRGERIEIFNCYERDDVMLPLTHYSEVSLNGITYSNATDLQSVLQTVIYSRATLGSDEVEVVEQNNIGKVIYLDYVSGSDLLTQVLGDINSQTTLISATDNPVFFTAYKSASTASVAQKLRFQFMGGKGTWGAGGNAVLPSHLYQLPPESLLPEDITANSKSNVISLGQVTNEPEFLTKANSAVRDLTDTSKLHYFSYSLDSVLYLKRFTGQPGEYDGTQTVLTKTDFNEATNSNVQPGLYLPTLKDITAVDSFTDSPITITDNNTGDNITFSGSSIKHTSVNGDTTILDYQPNTEDVTYSIPAKTTDDVFAMQSDVNGITIVSNQSSSELYLKNVDGTTLATINLGFLNNEGTTFFYNETSEKLELKNDDGEVLSEVPVSAFVANLMQSVNFNGATPYILEFKDAEGNVVDSVSFSISNIQGLQALLDAKISYTDMDSVPTSGSNNSVKSGGIYDMIRKYVVSTETNLDNYNEAGYFLTPSSGVLNLPNGFSQTRYTLTVNAANLNYGSQILVSCGGDGAIAIRRKSNTWGAWSVIALDSNVVKTVGDQISINGTKGWIARQIYNGVITKPFPDIRRHKYLASYSSNAAVVSGGIRVAIPMAVSSMWTMKLKVIEYSAAFPSNSNTVSYFEISGYGTNLVANKSVWCSNPNNYTQVRHGRNNDDNKTVIFIDKSTAFAYPKVIIENIDFYYSGYDGNDYYDITKYECSITTDESDFVQNSIITNNQFVRDNYYLDNNISSTYTRPVNSGSYGLSGASINDLPIGTYTATLSTNTTDIPFTSVGGLISIGATNAQGTQILGSRTGNELWFRPYSNTYGSWYRLWNSGDFSQSDVTNWNTAFGWGNHDGKYLPLGADIPTEADLNTYLQTGIFIQRFNFQAAAGTNYPVPLKGFLEVLRTPEGLISQKYHVTGGDENNYYIRIFGNSWSSWKKILSNTDITDSNTANWNTAYNRGDFRDYGLGESILPVTDLTSSNANVNRFFRFLSSANGSGGFAGGAISMKYDNAPSTAFLGANGSYAFVGYKSGANATPQFYKLWDTRNFSQADVNNWNTAYNRGDFKDYGLGINTTLIYPETDLNSITVPNGFYTVPNTILNIPTNAGGALTVERYSTYITQKYQAVNAGDVVRMFIRHYKAGSASWTPWREIWTDENFSPDDKAEVNDTLSFKGIIPSNDDINNYTVNGFYSTESSTTANLPVEDKGILTVASNGNDHSQTYTNYNSNEFYFRTSNPSGGAWNSWERVAKSSERVINDTLTTPPSAASLNALYASAKPTFTVIAPNVEKGNMYVKTNDGWLVFTGNTVF
ncbi:pyocin knob domain-containing protein [Flavobacterium beibuense]|uniref:pyocin knob domain-containing protein n=1 Tax=Flavobacterium beibuense TaxID=657326 RepID=UPI003A8EFF5F